MQDSQNEKEDNGKKEQATFNTLDALGEILARARFESIQVTKEEIDFVYMNEEELRSC